MKMPKSIAQLTGLIVTAIVTFGTDMDLTYAMPLGVASGMLATFFVSVMEQKGVNRRRFAMAVRR